MRELPLNAPSPRRCPQHGLARVMRGDLASLSRVNKRFRRACIATGLFANLEPRLMPTLHRATAFLSSIHRAYPHMKVDSLCVNLATPNAWPLCVRLLKLYPDVRELCLRGESSDLREWEDGPELEALRNGSSLSTNLATIKSSKGSCSMREGPWPGELGGTIAAATSSDRFPKPDALKNGG
jgi:hypothetical protein